MKKEDPNFVPPTSVHARETVARLGNGAIGGAEKRGRDDKTDEDAREPKRERIDDDSDAEEMEIEDDEETKDKNPSRPLFPSGSLPFLTSNVGAAPQAVQHPSARLLCTNLPIEVTNDVLSVLFQQ